MPILAKPLEAIAFVSEVGGVAGVPGAFMPPILPPPLPTTVTP
jgi:hypothetical protein